MKARRMSALFTALILVASFAFPFGAKAGAKRRIAILPFEYGAVSSEVGTLDVGKGITSLLITKLVGDGTYSVVDRQMLDAILKEQNLSVSDRADKSTACKIGKLLSVDAIVTGTVTQFGFESRHTDLSGAASAASSYIPYVGGFGFGGLGVHKTKVKVAIDARLIDINTSEILAVAHGDGESKRGGTSLFGGGGSGWSGGSGSLDMGSSGFATSIAGEATAAAVDAIGQQIVDSAAKIPDNQSIANADVHGKVADVTGTQVIVNLGKGNGLAIGDNLCVDRPYKTVKDPETGKVLKEMTNTIAIINLTQVDSDSSTGSIVKGSGVKIGDSVKKVTTDVSAVIVQPVPTSSRTMSTSGTVLGDGSKSPLKKPIK